MILEIELITLWLGSPVSPAEPAPDDVLVHLVPQHVVHSIAPLPHQPHLVGLNREVAHEARLLGFAERHH